MGNSANEKTLYFDKFHRHSIPKATTISNESIPVKGMGISALCLAEQDTKGIPRDVVRSKNVTLMDQYGISIEDHFEEQMEDEEAELETMDQKTRSRRKIQLKRRRMGMGLAALMMTDVGHRGKLHHHHHHHHLHSHQETLMDAVLKQFLLPIFSNCFHGDTAIEQQLYQIRILCNFTTGRQPEMFHPFLFFWSRCLVLLTEVATVVSVGDLNSSCIRFSPHATDMHGCIKTIQWICDGCGNDDIDENELTVIDDEQRWKAAFESTLETYQKSFRPDAWTAAPKLMRFRLKSDLLRMVLTIQQSWRETRDMETENTTRAAEQALYQQERQDTRARRSEGRMYRGYGARMMYHESAGGLVTSGVGRDTDLGQAISTIYEDEDDDGGGMRDKALHLF